MWDIIRCTLQCKTEILWTYLRHRIQLSSPKLKSKQGKKWERTKLRCWTTLKIHKISTLAKKKPTLILIWIVCPWGKSSKRSNEEQSHLKKVSLPRPKNWEAYRCNYHLLEKSPTLLPRVCKLSQVIIPRANKNRLDIIIFIVYSYKNHKSKLLVT